MIKEDVGVDPDSILRELQVSIKWRELHGFWLIVTWTLSTGNVCCVHALAESVEWNKDVGTGYCVYIDSFSVALESINSISHFGENFRFPEVGRSF